MKKWEYIMLLFPDQNRHGRRYLDVNFDKVSAYGKLGWELVESLDLPGDSLAFIFKRPVNESGEEG